MTEHMIAAKRIWMYVKGILDLALVYENYDKNWAYAKS